MIINYQNKRGRCGVVRRIKNIDKNIEVIWNGREILTIYFGKKNNFGTIDMKKPVMQVLTFWMKLIDVNNQLGQNDKKIQFVKVSR